MVASIVRTFTVLLCVLALLSACGSKPQATSAPTEASNGIATISIASYGAPSLGIVTDATLRVVSIDVQGAAARTPLQQDDVVTQWNGQSVTVESLRGQIAATNPTEAIEMTVQRGSTSVVIPVQLQLANGENTQSQIGSTPTPVPSNLYYF